MLKILFWFLVWVGACTLVYYKAQWDWAMPVFAVVTLGLFLFWQAFGSGWGKNNEK